MFHSYFQWIQHMCWIFFKQNYIWTFKFRWCVHFFNIIISSPFRKIIQIIQYKRFKKHWSVFLLLATSKQPLNTWVILTAADVELSSISSKFIESLMSCNCTKVGHLFIVDVGSLASDWCTHTIPQQKAW